MKLPYKQYGVILTLCLLCTLTVAPATARSPTSIIEDGVHLLPAEDHPTRLDRYYYKCPPDTTIAIDGDQYYWVQIEKETVDELTTVWWAQYAAMQICYIIFIFIFCIVHSAIKRKFPELAINIIKKRPIIITTKQAILYALPLSTAVLLLASFAYLPITDAVNHAACKSSELTTLIDGDGCVLLKVSKDTAQSDPILIKTGINLTTVYHIDMTRQQMDYYRSST